MAHRVDGEAAAALLQALHVPLLGAPQGHDALLGQEVQGDGVDALLVDHHERLVGRVAHLRIYTIHMCFMYVYVCVCLCVREGDM